MFFTFGCPYGGSTVHLASPIRLIRRPRSRTTARMERSPSWRVNSN